VPKLLFMLLAAPLLLSPQSPPFQPDASKDLGVTITLATDKGVYKPNEPIEVRAAILNGGSQPFYVFPTAMFASHGEGAFWPQLRDKNGKEISEGYRVGGHSIAPEGADFAEYVQQHWVLLRPGQFYGVAEKRFFGVKLHPGTYTLSVTYSNSLMPWVFRGWTAERLEASAKKLKYPAVVGSFVSQTVTFRVVQ
jgi:hypothetical protein